ncbi:MAG TPA: RNA 2'-phosphotransferase [Pyrinomonadaceae bacterium]|jgi:putative RNA 2'-phosphotransferase
MPDRFTKISKFLSLVLRHKPELIGLTLDSAGWVSVSELLRACQAHGQPLTLEELHKVISSNDKQRFSLSADERMIRANQGHSISVELGYSPAIPPDMLYHGTVEKFLPFILEEGLKKGYRHHVHLSPDMETARRVGQRRGKPIVLKVESGRMYKDGRQFFRSENGVWLTEHVPPHYLII